MSRGPTSATVANRRQCAHPEGRDEADGKPSLTFLPSRERPDLVRAGYPLEAGFNVTLTPPLRSGERIEVVFPNGQPLGGASCKA